MHLVVWQFWGRAAEASWTEKSRALFFVSARKVSLFRSPAGGTISAHLEPGNQKSEPAIFFHLPFEPLKTVAHKLGDLAAAQTGHVDMVALQLGA